MKQYLKHQTNVATVSHITGYTGAIVIEYKKGGKVNIAAGDIKDHASNEIVRSITLTDKGKTHLIGRVINADNPIHLKFDDSGDLQFRDASADGFIPIGSYAEFQKVISNERNKYRQETDLDLMDVDQIYIDNRYFVGEFDGAGKKISNVRISKGEFFAGLFRKNRGTIRNVHIVSGSIGVAGTSGSICGENRGQIISCSNAAYVSGFIVGGVVGNNSAGTITACYNTGAMRGGNKLGGVVGDNLSGAVTACYNTGAMTGHGGLLGGVVGYNNSSGIVTACYWESTTATKGIGGGTGTVDGVNSFTLPLYFNPTGTHVVWNTGTDGENGYWKAGTTDGSRLPKLWWEI
jgi:hypothetical protein